MNYDPELNEIAEGVLRKNIGDLHPDALLTRGIFICEFLAAGDDYRGVIAVQLGRQGAMQPYEVIGLLAPVETQARLALAGQIGGAL